MKDLILTGWGWKEYPVAAAVALKALNGMAEVLGMSRRRLPEFLEAYEGKSKRIIIAGVGLSGDEPRLGAALVALKKKGVRVVWISAIDFTDSQRVEIAPHLEAKVYPDKTLLESVGLAFGCSAGMFGAMSIYGYFTKRNLQGMGRMLIMALIGLIVAGVINIFWGNGTFDLAVSAVGVIVFCLFTAYDTQKILQEGLYCEDEEIRANIDRRHQNNKFKLSMYPAFPYDAPVYNF